VFYRGVYEDLLYSSARDYRGDKGILGGVIVVM